MTHASAGQASVLAHIVDLPGDRPLYHRRQPAPRAVHASLQPLRRPHQPLARNTIGRPRS